VRLHSVSLSEHAHAIGKPLAELGLNEVGAEVTAIRRSRSRIEVTPDTVFHGGDIVVLRGATEAIALAEARLLKA
jgi:CPA2 family monovalent cation:H+ antiporter-2